MKPFIKWAGGKRQILKRINEFINDSEYEGSSYTYIEPFLGGGAVFFDKRPQNAIINDLNSDLINAYQVIKSDEYLALINELRHHKEEYMQDKDDYYYTVRAWDREPGWPDNYSAVERAARMIFLNRTCYNGLYRVNSKGQFNTPIGRYSNPTICDEENITEIHNYLANLNNNIEIMNASYEEAIRKAKDGDIIYIDPPYDYEDDDGFTKYQMKGFTFEDFENLKKECDDAIKRGAFVIISNNATTKVLNLFKQDPKYKIFYDVNEFQTLRIINCKGTERKTGNEAIFWGMNSNVPFPQANDMNKIITLVMEDNNVLNDKKEAMKVLNVTTERQVAYYLSALLYLNYINHDKEFTERTNSIKNNEELVKKDIYEQLMSIDLFKEPYVHYKEIHKVNVDELRVKISKANPNMAESTINRRASTIKSWVEWMYDYDRTNLNLLTIQLDIKE